MTDIVKRLRTWCHAVDAESAQDLMDEAAAEIERLRNGAACPHIRGTVTQHCSLNFTLTVKEREAIGVAIQCVEAQRVQHHPEETESQEMLWEQCITLRSLLERLT
jgi:hypothetical protein